MNPQISQDLTPEEAKASMGIATHLMGQLQQPPPNGSETQNPDQQEAQPQEQQKDPLAEIDTLRSEIMSELQTMKEDMKVAMEPKDEKAQIADLKRQIDQAINE